MTAQPNKQPTVYARLATARVQLHENGLHKSGSAPNRRGNYFELGDFIVPAQKVLRENGLVGVMSYGNGSATLEVVNVEDPEQKIVFESPLGSARLPNCHEVQNIGAVQTYQRRYLWMTALEIVESDALEGSQVAEGQSQTGAASPLAAEEYDFPDGPATGISQLKQMVRPLWREIKGCGDEGELLGLLESPEAKAVIDQCKALQNPTHRRELWEGDGKDNPGLSGLIEQAKRDCAPREMNPLQAG